MSQAQAPMLQAVPSPIAIFSEYVAPATESLLLREKVFSWTGDSFSITSADGTPRFEVKGKKVSLSGRKIFTDPATGKELFHLRKEHFKLKSTYYGEDAAGQVLFEVKSKSIISFGRSTAYVRFTDAAGQSHSLVMKGDFWSKNSTIIDESTGAEVASISRNPFTAKDIFVDKQTYALNVAPGMDVALMCAACICFDEKNNEGHGGGGGGGGG